jgi:hypothetical protein
VLRTTPLTVPRECELDFSAADGYRRAAAVVTISAADVPP